MSYLISIIMVTGLCMLLAGIMIPQILLIAFRRNLVNVPVERVMHTSLVPRLGGMAFMPVVAFSIVLLLGIDLYAGSLSLLDQIVANSRTIIFSFCALLAMYVVGMGDDLIGIKVRAQVGAQVIGIVLLIVGGLGIRDLHGLLWINYLDDWAMWPVTLLVGLLVINSLNLIDGIDGLCSGLSSVAVVIYGVTFYIMDDYMYAILAFATLGVLVPFFCYNVYGNEKKRRKIFMGNTGSMTIGMLMCVMAFRLIQHPASPALGHLNMMALALSPLVIPCFDMVRILGPRLRKRDNPFVMGKNHIHHQLLKVGLNPRMALWAIVGGSLIFSAVNIALSFWLDINLVLLIDIVLFVAGMHIALRLVRSYKKKVRALHPKISDADYWDDAEAVARFLADHPNASHDEILAHTHIPPHRLPLILARLSEQ